MDRNRGLIVLGASLAALVAAWFIRKRVAETHAIDEAYEHQRLVERFEAETAAANDTKPRRKRVRRTTESMAIESSIPPKKLGL